MATTRGLPAAVSESKLPGDPRPVGVFDSGVGGVNVLREVRAQLPVERCVYLADSREAPYGSKPVEHVVERCRLAARFLLDQDVKTVVVACNTASVVALQQLRADYAIPFVGVVPPVKPAAGLTRTGTIGVLTTVATAQSDPLAQLIQHFADGVTVLTRRCPELVPLIERGIVDGLEIEAALQVHLDAFLQSGVDVIVLGCTHYPFLRPEIERMCGPSVSLLDPSEAVARQLGRVLAENGLASAGPGAPTSYYTTGDAATFEAVLTSLVGPIDGPIQHVSIEHP